MPTETGTAYDFDQLAESFENKVNQLCDLHGLPASFAEFMRKAKPEEITLLSLTLGQYSLSFNKMSLAECMVDGIKGTELETSKTETTTQKPGPQAAEQELPNWATETPVIQYTLEAFFGEDIERVEMALEEYETLKYTLAKMRDLENATPAFARRHS